MAESSFLDQSVDDYLITVKFAPDGDAPPGEVWTATLLSEPGRSRSTRWTNWSPPFA